MKFFNRRVALAFYRQATASWPRKIAFSVLLVWAFTDSVLTFRDWLLNDAPLSLAALGAVGSFALSLMFILGLVLLWDWLGGKFGNIPSTRI